MNNIVLPLVLLAVALGSIGAIGWLCQREIIKKSRWLSFRIHNGRNLIMEDDLRQAARWAAWQLEDPARGHTDYWRLVLADIRDRRFSADTSSTAKGTHFTSILVFAEAARNENPPIAVATMEDDGRLCVTRRCDCANASDLATFVRQQVEAASADRAKSEDAEPHG